jgi:putative transposase
MVFAGVGLQRCGRLANLFLGFRGIDALCFLAVELVDGRTMKERRRFGYRRLHVLLRRERFTVNHKRLFRLYREERLMVRRRGGRKRALGTRAPMLSPQLPNERWSFDFVADQFIDGGRTRILVVVDDCSRECLALIPETSISGIRVARELSRLVADRGKPKMIVSDNGTEPTSNAAS